MERKYLTKERSIVSERERGQVLTFAFPVHRTVTVYSVPTGHFVFYSLYRTKSLKLVKDGCTTTICLRKTRE